MKNRRLALAGTLAILSAVALAPKAQAQQSGIIDFSGTVTSTCTFGYIQAGILEQPDSNAEYMMAAGEFNGVGQSGSVELQCTYPGLISVSPPVKIQAPEGFDPTTTAQAVLDSGDEIVTSSTNGNFNDYAPWNEGVSSAPIPSGGYNSPVVMVVGNYDYIKGLPGGTYQYQVTVTVTPQ